MKRIFLLTNCNNIIPQLSREIDGLNLNIIAKVLEDNGFDVKEISIHNFIPFLNKNEAIKDSYFYYTSSQYPIYKNYILDILIQIKLRGGILLPELNHFIAHENKNFQELEKIRLNIASPYGVPIGTYEEGVNFLNSTTYPKILKKAAGFGSRNVKPTLNKKQGKKLLLNLLENNFKFNKESFYYLYRRFNNKKHYPKKFGKVIIQEYIPDLTYDYKILVLGKLCMGSKRLVRKNDFRASGSNLIAIDEDPPKEVLDFALKCKAKLSCPIVSLDIAEFKGNVQLLEYQSMHFSLLPDRLSHYFELENETWLKRQIKDKLEHYIGNGIVDHLKNQK